MKIVYLINNTWYSGGMTRVLVNKVNYLVENNYDVTVITTDQNGNAPHYYISEKVKFVDLSINYFFYNNRKFIIRLMYSVIDYFRHYFRLKAAINKLKPDVCVSMFSKEAFIASLLDCKIPKILEIHSSKFTWEHNRSRRGILGKIQNRFDHLVISKFDKFVILSKEDKKNWSGVKNLICIPNANTFQPVQSSSLTNNIALAIGRFDYQKNFSDLIRVWHIVVQKFPTWQLRIVGDGPDYSKLAEMISSQNLSHAVILKPLTSRIQEEYLDSSLYLMTSKYEGFPMVLLEAQSFGVPVVSYACPCGPRDIILDGVNGFLVREGDCEEFATKVIELIANKDNRTMMGRKAVELSSRFSEEKVMKMWTDLFSQLLNKS